MSALRLILLKPIAKYDLAGSTGGSCDFLNRHYRATRFETHHIAGLERHFYLLLAGFRTVNHK